MVPRPRPAPRRRLTRGGGCSRRRLARGGGSEAAADSEAALATGGGGSEGAVGSEAAIRDAAARIAALGESSPRPAPDPVNLPMIRHWMQAMGDTNPVYTDAAAVAPPAMTQVWTMRGLRPAGGEDPGDPLGLMSAALDEAGFTSVVATNSEQEYHRYLRLGEQVTVRSSLEEVTGPKRTALGEGWFVTTRSTWYVGTEAVASMMFRILKFRPAAQSGPPMTKPSAQPEPSAPPEPRSRRWPLPPTCCGRSSHRTPPSSGRAPPATSCGSSAAAAAARCATRRGRCARCAASPGPEYDVAAGTGEVYSYVVHHHPPVPGRRLPIVIALVELTEGVRMVGELLDIDPERVRIGLPVRVTFAEVDGELTLPAWREDRR